MFRIVSGFTTNQYLPQHTVERIVRAGGVGQDYPGHCHKYHCRHHLLPGLVFLISIGSSDGQECFFRHFQKVRSKLLFQSLIVFNFHYR